MRKTLENSWEGLFVELACAQPMEITIWDGRVITCLPISEGEDVDVMTFNESFTANEIRNYVIGLVKNENAFKMKTSEGTFECVIGK